MDCLKVEINKSPVWSHLWIYPNPKKPTFGIALVSTLDQKIINLLQILKENMND